MAIKHSVVNARNTVALAVVDVVLFLVANLTAKNSSHPGTASNIVFGAFLVGVAVLLALGVALIYRRRSQTRPA
jgi:hypothetical protein